jgi:hypothetical protein
MPKSYLSVYKKLETDRKNKGFLPAVDAVSNVTL